jgi:hypothetical protein
MTESVFLLWHVNHVAPDSDGVVRHFDGFDDYWADEMAGDDVKLLGAYSTRQKAIARTRTAATLSGFVTEPRCFHIAEYTIDADYWTDGFAHHE